MKRFVVKLTLTVNDDGTTADFYYSTHGFRTLPTDTPANTWVEPRILNLGKLRRELFSGARLTGAVRPSGATLRLNNDDGGLDAWIDYGISGSQAVYYWGEIGAAFPDDYEIVQILYIQSFKLDFSEVAVGLRDRLYLLDKPVVTSTFLGTGGIEGTGVASKKKQWVAEDPGYFPPIVVDVTKQIYFVQDTGPGSLSSFFQCFEGGVEISRDTDYASEAALTSATDPDPGTCKFWFGPSGDGPVYVRLGTPPTYEIRIFGLGYQADDTSWSFAALCRRAGLDDVTGSAGVVGARLVDDDSTYLEVMEASSAKYVQFFGFGRLDVFTVGSLAEPDEATSEHTFTVDNARDFRREAPSGMEAPVWQVTMNAGKTWPTQFQDAASDTMKDYLSRDPWWTSFTGSSSATLLANPGAIAAEVSTPNRDIQNTFAQTNFINRYLSLFGGRRDFMVLKSTKFTSAMLAIDLHDTVEVQIPRMQCDNGRFFRVVTIDIDWSVPEITFGLWGGTPGDGGGIDTGDGETTSDPMAIQSELGVDLYTEDGEVILIESELVYLQTEIDSPLLTEGSALILLE